MDTRSFRQLSGAAARLTAQLESATPIEQATGILAERYRTDVEEAARFLRSQARNAGTDIAEMAASVVAGTDGPSRLPEQRPDIRPARHAERPGQRLDQGPTSATQRIARHRRADIS
nr:ANTAR domain-containing protein [Pseudonocardia acidicola]